MKDIKKKNIQLDMYIIIFFIIGYTLYKKHNKCLIFLNKYLCVYDIMFITLSLIFFLGYFYHKNGVDKDILTVSLIDSTNDADEFDTWVLLHVALYFFCGIKYPNRHLFFLTIGYLWELFEHYNGIYYITFFGYSFNRGTDNDNRWWYGRLIDIVANATGYCLGSYVATHKIYNLKTLINELIF